MDDTCICVDRLYVAFFWVVESIKEIPITLTYQSTNSSKCVDKFVRMYACTYTRTYVHMYVHAYIRMYVHAYIRMYLHTYMYLHACMYVLTHVHVRMYLRTCTYTHTCMYLHTYVRTCMYIHMNVFKSHWSQKWAVDATVPPIRTVLCTQIAHTSHHKHSIPCSHTIE